MKTPKKLSDKYIGAIQPLKKRFTISDGFGLYLRIHPSGSKSWVLRLSQFGKVSDITLGRWPEMSLKAARQNARQRRKAAGLTPQKGYTLADAFRLWKDLKRGRIVSYRNEKRRIEQLLMRPIGNRQLDEITAPLVIQIIKPIDRQGKRSTVKRLLMRLREILDLAVCAGYIQHNPIERVSRVFAPPITKPMPSVPWQDLPTVMKVLSDAPIRVRQLFMLTLLLMLRPGEAAKLKWEWIEDGLLTIPAAQMKKRREHRVPLSPSAVRLLEEIKDSSIHPRSGFVFPAVRDGGKHISSQTLAKHFIKTSLKGQLVAHGLRSIARSWLADHGYQFEASEACLSHVSGSSVSRAYQRSDYLDQRITIMQAWSHFVFDCAECASFSTAKPRTGNGSQGSE